MLAVVTRKNGPKLLIDVRCAPRQEMLDSRFLGMVAHPNKFKKITAKAHRKNLREMFAEGCELSNCVCNLIPD